MAGPHGPCTTQRPSEGPIGPSQRRPLTGAHHRPKGLGPAQLSRARIGHLSGACHVRHHEPSQDGACGLTGAHRGSQGLTGAHR